MELLHGTDQWNDELTQEVQRGQKRNIRKFVAMDSDNESILSFFPSNKAHARIAFDLLKQRGLAVDNFLGAGKVGHDGEPYYDSMSCKENLNKDRPEDPQEAAKLLYEIREQLKEIGLPELQS